MPAGPCGDGLRIKDPDRVAKAKEAFEKARASYHPTLGASDLLSFCQRDPAKWRAD